MLGVIRDLLVKIIDDIDTGNSNISQEDEVEIIRLLRKYSRKDARMSKESACRYLGLSRSAFDSHVRSGDIPHGRKDPGFKELSWARKDLDKYVKSKH